ncbi:reverse transcriptase [Artemisia annua]|uniref:Reverse transcriptase n=1 Tax=Artemisia annua TaxID=35608 RepID=A0A2U1PIX0_ARTAN|nr:reverse transcriptase [Artemisia annua]
MPRNLAKGKETMAKALWRKLIDAKYGRTEYILSPAIPSKASVSPVWKKITDILHSRSPSGVVAKKGLVHCVGKGDCIRFWDDHWVEGHILKTSFPRIFALAAIKSGSVCDFGLWDNGQWKWNVKLRRKLFDWEVEQFNSFMLTLNSVVMMATRNDKVVWSFDSLGKFSSRSFGKEMEKSNYSDPILHSVWKFKAPPKAHLLCWQSIISKLPTRDVLLRFGIISENQSRCPLCKSCIESVDHLSIHCKFTLSIWYALISGWDCEWVIPKNMRTLFSWLMDMAKVVKCKEVWQTTFFSVVWHVWEARNKAIFVDNISSFWQVLDLVKFRTGCWVKAFSPACPYSLLDFHVNLFSITTCGSTMKKNDHTQQWCPPVVGSLKFNVDGAARGKSGPAALFSIPLGVLYSNVSEVMEIKKLVGCDSLNEVSWIRRPLERPWRLLSHFQEIDLFLSTNGNRSIAHIKREGILLHHSRLFIKVNAQQGDHVDEVMLINRTSEDECNQEADVIFLDYLDIKSTRQHGPCDARASITIK